MFHRSTLKLAPLGMISLAALAGFAPSVSAAVAPNVSVGGFMLGSSSVTTTMGTFTGTGPLTAIINQSGLSDTYVSLTTDFDTFVNNTTASGAPNTGNAWRSATGQTAGFVTFDLGAPYLVGGLALWQTNAVNIDRQVKDFKVYADDDANPATLGTELGSFTAAQTTAISGTAMPGQGWAFTPTTTQFIQLKILNTYTGATASLGEVAFASPVPEPMTLLGAGAAVSFGAFFKRRKDNGLKG